MPLAVWPHVMVELLPPLCVDVAAASPKTFGIHTGLGWDNVHPRALLRCSAQAIVALLRLLMLAELLGAWPTTIGCVLIAFLPKLDGGRRPLGLFFGSCANLDAHSAACRADWATCARAPLFLRWTLQRGDGGCLVASRERGACQRL